VQITRLPNLFMLGRRITAHRSPKSACAVRFRWTGWLARSATCTKGLAIRGGRRVLPVPVERSWLSGLCENLARRQRRMVHPRDVGTVRGAH
jgi:hypothetical protein